MEGAEPCVLAGVTLNPRRDFRMTSARPRYLAFLRRRLSPQGYLGLHVTLGLIVVVLACWVFGEITEDVVTGDPIIRLDQNVANFFNTHATPARTRLMVTISFFGSGAFLGVVTGLIALFLAWRRSWHRLLALLLAVPGGALINLLVKHLIQRHRPVFEHPIATLNSFSFPSGHTMGSTLFYGLMAAFAYQSFRSWKLRIIAMHGAGVIVALVGFSRICLGVHFLSDVLGAMAAGIAWLFLCLTAVETLRRKREKSAT